MSRLTRPRQSAEPGDPSEESEWGHPASSDALMPHNQGEVSCRTWTGLFAVTLGQGDDAIDARDGDVLDFVLSVNALADLTKCGLGSFEER